MIIIMTFNEVPINFVFIIIAIIKSYSKYIKFNVFNIMRDSFNSIYQTISSIYNKILSRVCYFSKNFQYI